MKHWKKSDPNSSLYKIEYNGKWEEKSCVEAKASTKEQDGWILREWDLNVGNGRIINRKRKFYGKVFIVRIK